MQPKPLQPSPSSTRKWLAVGLAVVISWVIFASSATRMTGVDGLAPPSLERSAVPRPAEFRWTLEDLDGNPVEFARFKGRPILLNLWATWCGPCLQEMPSIAALAANPGLKGRDVAIVCVSTDQSADALRKFLKDKDWNMTVLRATSIPPAFQSEGIPMTFLINRAGQVVTAEMGAARWDDPSVLAFLQGLAAEKP